MLRIALVVVAALAACKGKSKDEAKPGIGSALTAAPADRPKTTIDGPSITPVTTSSITFFVPKDVPWWGEMSFSCYAAAIRMQPGNSPSDTFTKISPAIAPALRAADIDLDKDLGAIGLWGCGDGACAYIAVQLRSPDKLGAMLEGLVPGVKPKTVSKDYYTVEAPGVQGPRTIHVKAVPINWPDKLPTDVWSREAARATHLVFITGLFGKTTEVPDPLTVGLDPQAAAAKVTFIESLLTDARGRCILGDVGKRPFQPGYELERARFAMAAPEGKSDPVTRLIGSARTVALEVELVLAPAATEQVVQGWIEQVRQFVKTSVEPVRAQFAGQGAFVDVIFEVGALLGKSGFRHTLADKSLKLSFRTDRISEAELMGAEAKLQGAMKQMGVTP